MKCALQGCNRPPWPSEGRTTPHLACGNLHHQLLMASLLNPTPYQAIIDRNADGLCALPSCEEPPHLHHSWCSRTHYLVWLNEFTSSLQICKFPHCTRNVFVERNGHPSEFCGWQHRQNFVVLNAHQRIHRQEPLPSMEDHPPSIERECDLNSLMDSLKQFTLFATAPKNIIVQEDFYEKHPWEVFTEGRACWLIVRLKFSSKARELTTKGHYHWKQSGPPVKHNNYTEKWYNYKKREGKEEAADQHKAESSYSMKEYTIEDVTSYALIKLSKGKCFSHGKRRRKQPSEEQDADVDHVCSQAAGTSNPYLWDDDMSVDSILRGLAPLDSNSMGLPPLDIFTEDYH